MRRLSLYTSPLIIGDLFCYFGWTSFTVSSTQKFSTLSEPVLLNFNRSESTWPDRTCLPVVLLYLTRTLYLIKWLWSLVLHIFRVHVSQDILIASPRWLSIVTTITVCSGLFQTQTCKRSDISLYVPCRPFVLLISTLWSKGQVSSKWPNISSLSQPFGLLEYIFVLPLYTLVFYRYFVQLLTLTTFIDEFPW